VRSSGIIIVVSALRGIQDAMPKDIQDCWCVLEMVTKARP
jgi:hypothetical protein